MIPSSLYGHCAELLGHIATSRQPADAVVHEFFRNRHYLGSKDRRFIGETVYDILRHSIWLQAMAEAALSRMGDGAVPGSTSPLRKLAAWLLLRQNQDPSGIERDLGALWNTYVRTGDLSGFLGVLADAHAAYPWPEDAAVRLALVHSIPLFVVRDWVEQFGEAEAERLCAASNQPAFVSIRVNTLKGDADSCCRRLAEEGIVAEPGRLMSTALMVTKRMNAQGLRSFRDGLFEIQDEGSQMVSLLLEARPGQKIVDACAGGGGKSLHLAALMENAGIIKAFDISPERLSSLRERMRRAGAEIIETTPASAGALTGLHGWADAVLIDAPCSGTGTFRRNPGAKIRLDSPSVDALVRTQRKILERNAPLVRPGGRLVYATCSLLSSENQRQTEAFLAAHPEFHRLDGREILRRQDVNVEFPGEALVLFPHRTGTDGFFAEVFERRSDAH